MSGGVACSADAAARAARLAANLAALRDGPAPGDVAALQAAAAEVEHAHVETLVRDADAGRARAAAAELGFSAMTEETIAADAPGPVVLAGLREPWMLERLARACAPGPDGYRPRISVVEPNAAAAASALSAVDLGDVLGPASVELFLGDDAAERFEQALHERLELQLPKGVVRSSASDQRVVALERAVSRARSAQRSALDAAHREIAQLRAGRDAAWWAARYVAASAAGDDEALRVLVLSSRYSTFVQHAASRLAGAVDAAGHRGEVLIEPTDDAKLSALAGVRRQLALDPDMVVSINWPRALLGSSWPGGVPSVCWVQDLMSQLLDERVGAAQSELDFVAGQIHASLFRDYGYPSRNRLFWPVPACGRTFREGAVDRASAERFACDVAYISHQSAPAAAALARAQRTMANGPGVARALERIAERLSAELEGDGPTPPPDCWAITSEVVCAEAGRDVDAATVGRFHLQFALPLAERMHRHTTLRWARDACAALGLRFRVFGRGWSDNAEFARYAGGPVSYGEELRAAYATPACHLHASLCTNAHQRVAECALSGGVMLRRGPTPDRSAIVAEMVPRIAALTPRALGLNGVRFVYVPMERGEPDESAFDAWRFAAALNEDSPRAVSGEGLSGRMRVSRFWPADRPAWAPRHALETYPDWSYDTARETMFETKAELAAMIERAASDGVWRARVRGDHRSRAVRFNTFDAFWRRLVGTVRQGLDAAATRAQAESDARRSTLSRNLDALSVHDPQLAATLRERAASGEGRALPNEEGDGAEASAAAMAAGATALEGLGDGRTLMQLAARPAGEHGRRDAVYVIEPDVDRVLAWLRAVDVSGEGGVLRRPEVRWFVGDGWSDALHRAFADEPMLPEPVRRIRHGGGVAGAEEAWALVTRARAAQRDRDLAAARRWAAQLDDASVAAALRGDADERPRAMLLTSRFTTVLRHSAASTARALGELGWDVATVVEGADHERVTEAAVLSAIAQHRPHVVLAIDHHRSVCPSIPERIPFICWVQDDLPGLIAPGVGATLGPRDFVIGAWMHRYVAEWGYPSERCVMMPRLTDAGSVGARSVDAPLDGVGADVDVAYVSNHSVEPRRALSELASALGAATREARAAVSAGERLIDVYERGGSAPLPRDVAAVVEQAAADEGIASPATTWVSNVTEVLNLRLNNPLYRQQGLAWAMEACAERGLRLGVYGRGWERHPHFASAARGEIGYGEALSALTARAAFTLRLEPFPAMCHQRLLDACAAGGFVVSRLLGRWEAAEHAFVTFFLEHLAGRVERLSDAQQVLGPADYERLVELAAEVERVFPHLPLKGSVVLYAQRHAAGTLADYEHSPLPPEYFASAFMNAAELGAVFDRFADAAARRPIVERRSRFVRERYGYAAGLRRMLDEVARRIDAGCAANALEAA